MTKKQITEGNRLITQFMDWELIQTKDELKAWVFRNKKTKRVILLNDTDQYDKKFFNKDSVLEFHKSWDVLMPVCKKIASEDEVMKYKVGELISECNFEITRIFKAIVEHIKRRKK